MGAPLSEQAGKGGGWPDASGSIHVFVADRLRTCGWSVTIIPEDYDEDAEEPSMFDLLKEADDAEQEGRRKRQKTGERTLRERELAHIRSSSWDYDSIKVFDADQKLIASFTTMSLDNPWLSIGCLNNQVSDRIYQLLQEDYDLAKFPHVREELPINTDAIDSPGSYRLEAVTGAKLGGETKSSVTTHFSVYYVSGEGGQSNDKVVAKALCSYENGEMNSVGPTLELIETAKEWQQHGLGDALMRAIHSFYCAKFEQSRSRILFSVCHVTNFNAGKWFMRKHHFRDLDGMGEELGKYLYADEYADDGGDSEEEVEGEDY
jgi:hypothetical protein